MTDTLPLPARSGPPARPDAPPGRGPRVVARRVGSVVLAAGVVAIAASGLRGSAGVWGSVTSMRWPVVALLGLASVWNLLSYGWVQAAATPGLRFSQALVVTHSSTAVANTVPGGGALGVGVTASMCRAWGISPAGISLAVVTTGVWNVLVKLGLPCLALGLLLLAGDASAARVTAALVGLVVLVVVVAATTLALRDDRAARRLATGAERITSTLRGVARRAPVTGWAEGASNFRADAHALLAGRWARLTATMLASHLSLLAVLFLALRGVGIGEDAVSWIEIVGAFAFVRLLSMVPLSPGGVGVVELGLTGALVAAGADRGAAVAGVLVFRTLTYLLPVLAGLPAYVVWRRRRSWRVA